MLTPGGSQHSRRASLLTKVSSGLLVVVFPIVAATDRTRPQAPPRFFSDIFYTPDATPSPTHHTHLTHSQQISQVHLAQTQFKPFLPYPLTVTPCRITGNGVLNHVFRLFVNHARMVVRERSYKSILKLSPRLGTTTSQPNSL